MKVPIIVGLSVLVVAGASAVLVRSNLPLDTSIVLQSKGLQSLKCNGVEYLDNGEFRVNSVSLKGPDRSVEKGSTAGKARLDSAHQTLTETFPWGTVKIAYSTSGNEVALAITTTNTSDANTIQGLWYEPLILKFPSKVKEYDGSVPLLAHSVNDVGAVKVSYESGALAVVNEDVAKPLMVGFPWANNRPANTIFPLSLHTDRVASYPDSYPVINRPIPPGGKDEYHVSIRFGRPGATESPLAADVYKKFGETFPSRVNWKD